MENNVDLNVYKTQEIKLVDRSMMSLSGINKIISFDAEEFYMESVLGSIILKGETLELVKLDTHDGNVKIKGKINSFAYVNDVKKKEESIISKLFK